MGIGVTRPELFAPQGRERAGKSPRVPGLIQAIWAALFLNVLTFGGTATLVPIPASIGKLIAQGSLPLALLLVLVANPRGLVRVNLFMILLTVLAVLGLIVSLHNEFFLGSTYRAARFLLFVTVLWLLTPWWGRRDMLLLRCHRRVVWVALGTVLCGAVLSPGLAFSFEGRLAGVIWPIWPTGVAHLAATLFGTSLVLWICRVITGRTCVSRTGHLWCRLDCHSHEDRRAGDGDWPDCGDCQSPARQRTRSAVDPRERSRSGRSSHVLRIDSDDVGPTRAEHSAGR